MTVVGYARVSTQEQDPQAQVDELVAHGCGVIYAERQSGALRSRPKLDECLAALQDGDTLVVVRLDRLGRSLPHLLAVAGDLDARGVRLRSLHEAIDTRTPTGRLILGIFAVLAEYERELIRERTRAALATARARGRVGGRRRVMTARRVAAARSMYDSGDHTLEEIAATIGVSRSSVVRALREGATT